MYDAYCIEHYADGSCDQGCNVPECMWDGLDCVSERHFAAGRIIIVVAATPVEFAEVRTVFLRQIGQLLHAVVTIAKDSHGNDMIEPWDIFHRDKRSSTGDVVRNLFRSKRAASMGYVLVNSL